MSFGSVAGIICILVFGLLPLPCESLEPLTPYQAGFYDSCPDPARFTARTQNLNLAQSKTTRRQANLALVTSSGWPALIQVEGHLAHASYSRAAYSSLQISHPSGRAPPSLAAI